MSSNEILEALTDPLNSIVSAVKSALERTPPELGADIAERGMVLTGGGALLRDVDRLLMEETGLPVIVADDPLTCVVRGCGKALENMEKLADDLHVATETQARTSTRRRSGDGASSNRRDAPHPGRAARRSSTAGPSPLARLAFFGLLSIALLFADTRYRYLERRPPGRRGRRSIRCSARCRCPGEALAYVARLLRARSASSPTRTRR